MINTSADARNKVLSDWKDLGGRTAIIDSLKNTFEGLESILKPIHEAFKDIFLQLLLNSYILLVLVKKTNITFKDKRYHSKQFKRNIQRSVFFIRYWY